MKPQQRSTDEKHDSPLFYILRDNQPVAVRTGLEWAAWYETADRRIAVTKIGKSEVTTIFLAIDHAWWGGPPLLFETRVFGGALHGEMERYTTPEESKHGHAIMVGRVRETLRH
jgi:hypothetical protein